MNWKIKEYLIKLKATQWNVHEPKANDKEKKMEMEMKCFIARA